ncbi:peptidoglycan DD-metalloendopeptidase family protein [Streptomyces sp. NPDC052396]|uniref:M23 family metallopeptidase n=1 Tax=Streptomyces sp. NPDC052396 TaxID=3365689 RepID=UPI0037CD9A26
MRSLCRFSGPFLPGRGTGRRCVGVTLCALCTLLAPLPTVEPSAAVRAPAKVARVGLEVYRLAQEAGRAKERYQRGLAGVRERRERARRAAERLRGQRRIAQELHAQAGAEARAQYRTGGFTAPGSLAAADDPAELLALQKAESERRELLAVGLAQAEERSRALAVEERSAVGSWQELEQEVTRLRQARGALDEQLSEARDVLNGLAEAAVGSGRCRPVDRAALDAGDAAHPAGEAHQGWTRPVLEYQLSAGFGGTGANWASTHTGQDFAVPVGTPVRAIGPGTVVAVGCGGAFGISLVIRHSGGWYSQYAHLAAPFVTPGRPVRAGEWIGLSGTTGNSTGPHLHFEVRTSPEFGSAVDPVEWLRRRGVLL